MCGWHLGTSVGRQEDGGRTWAQGERSRRAVLGKAVVRNEVPALPGHADTVSSQGRGQGRAG